MTKELAPRWPALALVAVGLAFAVYLEFIHVQTFLAPNAEAVCSVNEDFDCSVVALSRFAVFAGVPLTIWGFAGFVSIGFAVWHRSRLLLWLTGFAALASVGLFVEAAFFVGSICLFCEGVHVVCLLLLGYAWVYRRRMKPDGPTPLEAAEVFGLAGMVLVAAFFIVPRYWALTAWQDGVPHPHGLDDDGRPWVGAETPELVLHEFTDYSCNHCAVGTARTRQRLASHPDKLRIVRHQQPRMHCTTVNHGCSHVRAALCAQEQGKFWEMDSWLFLHAPGKQLMEYAAASRDLGLDHDALTQCMEREDIYEFGERDYRDSTKKKVRETPGYYIDGVRLRPSEALEAIDAAL